MTDKDKPEESIENTLEQGTYEIIRDRLQTQGRILKEKIAQLNSARKEVFGTTQMQLIGNERISTDNNCEARDMMPVGDYFLFGYNVHIGLKAETKIEDVFSYYSFIDGSFKKESTEVLQDEEFLSEFKNLYKYYKNATFVKFVKIGPFTYFIFQIGKSISDVKAFKWSLQPNNKLVYIDSRSEHEVKFPDQHEFVWKRTTADQQRRGAFPHISIEDICFVETTDGDLTIKVEDNTDTGKGIYSEPIDYKDQNLDDADISYAIVGDLVVLKIIPYQEKESRFLLFNAKLQEALRIDSLESACVLLPDDHGVIFPKGYYLHSGEYKLFDIPMEGMVFEKRIASPNGEDFIYVFYNQVSGDYVLLKYNLIEQTLDKPIVCNGYSLFENGEMCMFKSDAEPKKFHAIQIWKTPFYNVNYQKEADTDNFLYKIGNKDVVRFMANCTEIEKLIKREETYPSLYLDIVRFTTDIIDSYHWIDSDEAFQVDEPLKSIAESAKSAVEEFEKVEKLKATTAKKTEEVEIEYLNVQRDINVKNFDKINHFVDALNELRTLKGMVISLRELRYHDEDRVQEIEEQITKFQTDISNKSVEFLLTDKALLPYISKASELEERISNVKKVVEANTIESEIKSASEELDLLIQIVSNLDIEDSTETTRIIDSISDVYGRFNTQNSELRRARKNLFSKEAKSEFGSQLKLINQSATNYLNISDTPEKCDDYLNKLMIQYEELEGKYVEFPEFSLPLTESREEIYNAFENRKVYLIEQRSKRSEALHSSAERIIKGIKNRLANFDTTAEINGYYASDVLVQKVRKIVDQLKELTDVVKADEIQSLLKSAKDEAFRQLRDKKELFAGDKDAIKFGNHFFSVNRKKLDVTIVSRKGILYYHLTGTDFYTPIADEKLESYRPYWNQSLISENDEVYRGEYLAYLLYQILVINRETIVLDDTKLDLEAFKSLPEKEAVSAIAKFMSGRYEEAYSKGIHDVDAHAILSAVLDVAEQADVLVYASETRAYARYFWTEVLSKEEKTYYKKKLTSAGYLTQVFGKQNEYPEVITHLTDVIKSKKDGLIPVLDTVISDMASYLVDELGLNDTFAISKDTVQLKERFYQFLKKNKLVDKYTSIEKNFDGFQDKVLMKKVWMKAFFKAEEISDTSQMLELIISDAPSSEKEERVLEVNMELKAELKGSHSFFEEGKFVINFNDWIEKLARFTHVDVVNFEKYQDYKHHLIETFRKEERLKEFEPKVMNSFVRNELIDEVYLPLIGNNLAKQMGTAGEDKRTDLMGMLLLISPPGYGKTTLMEYLANRLGLIFMKINGPTIGHEITSLDSTVAKNSAAREELEKLNLAFEMGDNVMIYLDDIQHCNPEFLQKFISLCDAQRKIEGIYKGVSKTYDFKGKRVAVVMAGNPYTESGSKFQIPDMLTNRADIYNLGDIIEGKGNSFQQSYLENCLTSNALLSKLASKSVKDVKTLIKAAETGDQSNIDLEANHTTEELGDYLNLLKKTIYVRDVVFKVNMEYIYSASQNDDNRVEPKFQLQGSYRDMNKIVEKLVPIMNMQELELIISSHYKNEAQTLTSGAEFNLLKFKSMMGWLTESESMRLSLICTNFAEEQKLKSLGRENSTAQIALHLEKLVSSIRTVSEHLKK